MAERYSAVQSVSRRVVGLQSSFSVIYHHFFLAEMTLERHRARGWGGALKPNKQQSGDAHRTFFSIFRTFFSIFHSFFIHFSYTRKVYEKCTKNVEKCTKNAEKCTKNVGEMYEKCLYGICARVRLSLRKSLGGQAPSGVSDKSN